MSALAHGFSRAGGAAAEATPVLNAAGGVGSFAVSDEKRLLRFLILGAEGGTYYASERKLTLECAAAVARLIEAGRGSWVVAQVLAVSLGGRAAKQTPTMFALAMVSRLSDVAARRAAYAAVPRVCRTPTMLFEYLELHQAMAEGAKGWGRGLRRAVAEVYCGKAAADTAFAVTKYRQRNGWTHRDVLRLAHVKPSSVAHQVALHYAAKGDVAAPDGGDAGAVADAEVAKVVRLLTAVEAARTCEDEATIVALIAEHKLAREHVPSALLNSRDVWAALLPTMPLTALLRNLAKMTAVGLLAPLADATATAVAKLTDQAALKRARVHPFSVLVALSTYRNGRGHKGSLEWEPVPEVVAALEDAFYKAFGCVVPTGKRFVLGLDVSGSMSWGGGVAGSCLTPREAAAAMAMVALRTEPRCHPMAFSHKLVPCKITGRDSLDTVLKTMDSIPMGGTDCALPMLWAAEKGVEADVFVVYTDCETWARPDCSPAEALRRYRKRSGIADAKLVVVAMTSGGFSIADPDDAGMLDVVGFDAAAPLVMNEFIAGRV